RGGDTMFSQRFRPKSAIPVLPREPDASVRFGDLEERLADVLDARLQAGEPPAELGDVLADLIQTLLRGATLAPFKRFTDLVRALEHVPPGYLARLYNYFLVPDCERTGTISAQV